MANVPISNMTVTWTDSGTTYNAIKMNVIDNASNANSLLMDLQVGGNTKLSITKAGLIQGTGGYYVGLGGGLQSWFANINVVGTVGFGPAFTSDTILVRDGAANTLALRNTTNPQTFYVYNTTDGTNSERGFIRWNANVLEIGAEKVGTGTPRNVLIKSNSGVLTLNDGNSAMTLLSGDLQVGTRSLTGVTSIIQNSFHQMTEMTAPAAPAANNVRIYAEDNGAGKTRLMALFNTGVAQQIAIEP